MPSILPSRPRGSARALRPLLATALLLALPAWPASEPDFGGLRLPPGEPFIEVVYHNRRTTDLEPNQPGHARWTWSFGDGSGWIDPLPGHTRPLVFHRYRLPGIYQVTASSYSAEGRLLRRQRWRVVVRPDEFLPRDGLPAATAGLRLFRAQTVEIPTLQLRLHGPRLWLSARPAAWRLELEAGRAPCLDGVRVRYDPAPRFHVAWRKPGTFQVDGAAVVTLRYAWPDGAVTTVRKVVVVHRSLRVLGSTLYRP
ncbi:MAG: PKD domain-containing protein [Bacillota bacterium]|nr:PKD domain-containing protein [Bacillota bacterium]